MDTSFLRSVGPDELHLLTEINDDACLAYGEYGLSFDLREDHPFVLAEAARWKASALAGHAFFACAPDPVGSWTSPASARPEGALPETPRFTRRPTPVNVG